MTRATTWTNDDGLIVGFGKNYAERQATAVVTRAGHQKQAILDFTYESTSPALSLPADSVVLGMTLIVSEAWNDGTDLQIGDGDDANGWFTETLLAEATLDNTAPQVFAPDGAYAIGDNADNRANPKVYATADTIDVTITGTFTSGKARLIVDYIAAQQ